MNFPVQNNIKRLLVLGAGASAEYGLPTWDPLSTLIKKKIEGDTANSYQHKKHILRWLDKVGAGKDYSTLDECISKESGAKENHHDGLKVENQIFLIMKEVFAESSREENEDTPDNELGWIRLLNEKILNDTAKLESSLAFISYNYDRVLDENFLNYSYLSEKRNLNQRKRVAQLLDVAVSVFYPHGAMYPDNTKHLNKYLETAKTGESGLLDVVSCFEENIFHTVYEPYERSPEPRDLYILGLGKGLVKNLGNINIKVPIGNIHVTIKSKELLNENINFLAERFRKSPGDIQVHKSCRELVVNCF